jgi:hypothetical protein
MHKVLLIFFCFFFNLAHSQTGFQLGIGAGLGFLQSVKLTSGSIGLQFKHDKHVFIDYNKVLSKKKTISGGAQVRMNLTSYWYEPNKSIPYYSLRPHSPIFEFESLEFNVYVKKYFLISKGENSLGHLIICGGPAFNINEGSSTNTRHGLRDDNGQTFQISRVLYKAQKPYVPYVRISIGVEFLKKIKDKYFLGVSPYLSWVGLQSENNDLTVLRNDPIYISTGKFKRNQNGYGIRFIFSK